LNPALSLYTDAHAGYRGLDAEYIHETVKFMRLSNVRDFRNSHETALENFLGACFKRAIKGQPMSPLKAFPPERLRCRGDLFGSMSGKDNDGGRLS